jgi:hypothetical protein
MRIMKFEVLNLYCMNLSVYVRKRVCKLLTSVAAVAVWVGQPILSSVCFNITFLS